LKERTDLFDGKPKRMLHVAPEAFFTPIFRAERNIDYLSGDLDPGNPEIGGHGPNGHYGHPLPGQFV
jgi:hypothetical protein